MAAMVAFMGGVQANSFTCSLYQIESQDIDPRLVDELVEKVAGQCELSACEVREAYAEGRMEVEIIDNGYQVRIVEEDGGGLLIIDFEDSL